MKKMKKIVMICLVFALGISTIHMTKAAGNYLDYDSDYGPSISKWATPVRCHIRTNMDGTNSIFYNIIDGNKQHLIIDILSKNQKISHRVIDVPGTTWGGCIYQAQDGNYYIATGNASGSSIAYYISKYNSNWELIKTTQIGKDESFTNEAFYAGNCDMAVSGKHLIVHTSKHRTDGHQSNITFYINTDTMEVEYNGGEFGNWYTSHSFNQFVKSQGNQIFMIDQGDAYPRAIYFQKFQLMEENGQIEETDEKQLYLMEFKGEIGQNYTGTTIDGFELGSQHHVVVGASIPHPSFATDTAFDNYVGPTNLYVSLIDKSGESSSLKWLTNYKGNTSVDGVRVLKINDDEFAILYGTTTKKNDEYVSGKTHCMIIDSNGNIQKNVSVDQPFICNSEASMNGSTIIWANYKENSLGRFLVKNEWNIKTGKLETVNIQTGFKSKIKRLEGDKTRECKVGKKIKLNTEIYSSIFKKDEFATGSVVWKSSDPTVARVEQNETTLNNHVTYMSEYYKETSVYIKGEKAGTATITAEIGDKSYRYKVIVGRKGVENNNGKLTIKGISKKIAAGRKVKLKVSTGNKKIKWLTSNKKFAIVNKNGVVNISKKAGGRTVTITAKDGSGKKATYKIKIMKGVVKKVKISGKKAVKAGEILNLKATVTASKGANKKLIWKSNNTKYATVSALGEVKAAKTAKKKLVKITAMATDGSNKKATIKIKIK